MSAKNSLKNKQKRRAERTIQYLNRYGVCQTCVLQGFLQFYPNVQADLTHNCQKEVLTQEQYEDIAFAASLLIQKERGEDTDDEEDPF